MPISTEIFVSDADAAGGTGDTFEITCDGFTNPPQKYQTVKFAVNRANSGHCKLKINGGSEYDLYGQDGNVLAAGQLQNLTAIVAQFRGVGWIIVSALSSKPAQAFTPQIQLPGGMIYSSVIKAGSFSVSPERMVHLEMSITGTISGTLGNYIGVVPPVSPKDAYAINNCWINDAGLSVGQVYLDSVNQIRIAFSDFRNFSAGAGRGSSKCSLTYRAA